MMKSIKTHVVHYTLTDLISDIVVLASVNGLKPLIVPHRLYLCSLRKVYQIGFQQSRQLKISTLLINES